ncbi:uncharacterized protein [Rutidosis leptorrhynchoides]|uniref:uncharacterized protein n=1 Tax=Rutidosis leptorrhynchoides TaxID=125765 RepID=UPI003A998A7C
MHKRTVTLKWDHLDDVNDNDDDEFFESTNRLSVVVPLDMPLLEFDEDNDDQEFNDARVSFSQNLASNSFKKPQNLASNAQYDMWMVAPGSITDRRRKLLQGMGLTSNKDFARLPSTTSTKFNKAYTKRLVSTKPPDSTSQDTNKKETSPNLEESKKADRKQSKRQQQAEVQPQTKVKPQPKPEPEQHPQPKHKLEVDTEPEPKPQPKDQDQEQDQAYDSSLPLLLVRSRSDSDIETTSYNIKRRKQDMIGSISKQRLTRTSSELIRPSVGLSCRYANILRVSTANTKKPKNSLANNASNTNSHAQLDSFFVIKNLDTGKEFVVKDFNDEGMCNKVSDLQTGKQLTMDEFEKTVGHSPVVKELMRRTSRKKNVNSKLAMTNSYVSKSFRYSKKKGAALLKNLKGSMSGSKSDKEKEKDGRDQKPKEEPKSNEEQKPNDKNANSKWVKAKAHGKPLKEFSALNVCQEIQAHDGSIWTMRFSFDGQYLASGGEDKVIHVWEVQECDVMSMQSGDEMGSSTTPDNRPPIPDNSTTAPEKKKKPKNNKNKSGIPDYVKVPESMFGLSENPVCTFKGHQDDVLDLSWSRSQLLLSSSMDKTVRLWDVETKNCLKQFAHSDYVTCIQFNPTDDDYFISGSLDKKIRMWSVPSRKVVDWSDLHDMITAVCYYPDGQGAIVGLHNGNCKPYNTTDCKLEQKDQIELHTKPKAEPKKITGFQFSPSNASEMLVTSADSRVRIMDGPHVIEKLIGYKNTSSQFSAQYSADGKYIFCASEDSQVYIWKHEKPKNSGGAKPKYVTTTSYEHFPCTDVTVALPWHGTSKLNQLDNEPQSKRRSKKSGPLPTDNNVETKKSKLPPVPKKGTNDNSEQTTNTDASVGESGDGSLQTDGGNNVAAAASSAQSTVWGLVIVTAGVGGEIKVYQNVGLPVKVGYQTLF